MRASSATFLADFYSTENTGQP